MVGRSSIADPLVLRVDSSRARPALPASSLVDLAPNTLPALGLLAPADPALRAVAPASAHGQASADHVPADSADRVRVVPALFHLQAKLRVLSVLQGVHAAATSSIPRPRKAR